MDGAAHWEVGSGRWGEENERLIACRCNDGMLVETTAWEVWKERQGVERDLKS